MSPKSGIDNVEDGQREETMGVDRSCLVVDGSPRSGQARLDSCLPLGSYSTVKQTYYNTGQTAQHVDSC